MLNPGANIKTSPLAIARLKHSTYYILRSNKENFRIEPSLNFREVILLWIFKLNKYKANNICHCLLWFPAECEEHRVFGNEMGGGNLYTGETHV
jgi:hypothetical protein